MHSQTTTTAPDPAIAAVRRWLAANLNERFHAYSDPDLPDDDPQQEALYLEEGRLWQEMVDTSPQTAAGLAIMLAAAVYRIEATAAGKPLPRPRQLVLRRRRGRLSHPAGPVAQPGSGRAVPAPSGR